MPTLCDEENCALCVTLVSERHGCEIRWSVEEMSVPARDCLLGVNYLGQENLDREARSRVSAKARANQRDQATNE
jgi:hypothetical protein